MVIFSSIVENCKDILCVSLSSTIGCTIFILWFIHEINLEFQNCSDPLFLIPLLSRAIKKNIFSKIINQNKIYVVLGKNNIFIHDDIKNNDCSDFILNLSTNEYQISKEINSLDYNILNTNISNGLNPDQSSWDEISDLAFRTYVPESEESREKGAGGGDAND